jgi:peptidyl-prolyl cis-trans isomerase SurA
MLQRTTKQLLIASVLLVLLVGPAMGELVSKVAAVINDTIITTYQLEQKIIEISAQNPDYAKLDAAALKAFRLEVLNGMIEEELLLQRADDLGLSVSDDALNAAIDDVQQQNKLTRLQLIAALEQQGMSFDAYRDNMRNQILRYQVIGQEVQSKVDVTGQEIRLYYEEHIEDYRNPPYVHLSHIMFNVSEEATPGEIAANRANAEKARSRLLMGDSIADLLATYSEASGGDMGKLNQADMATAFANAVANLQSGEISAIIETPGSLYIFKMLERNNGNPRPLETVRPEIEKILLEKNREEAFMEWQTGLKKNAYIDIRD